MANDTGLKIEVCHFPPGTSKWNKIEHRLFCHITRNWQGIPLETIEIVVNLIGNTSTREGLEVHGWLDEREYQKARKITDTLRWTPIVGQKLSFLSCRGRNLVRLCFLFLGASIRCRRIDVSNEGSDYRVLDRHVVLVLSATVLVLETIATTQPTFDHERLDGYRLAMDNMADSYRIFSRGWRELIDQPRDQ